LVSKKSKSMANILNSYCTSNFCDCRQTGAMISVIWLQSWLSAFDDVNPVVGQALASVVDGQWEWNLQLILRFFHSASIVVHAFPCRLLVKDSHFRHTNYDTEDKNEQ
ncbi:hypothetical protein T4C_12654, partial [Trichinella pseudospiralis]